MIEDLVVRPRKTENKKIQKLEWKFPYQYHKVRIRTRILQSKSSWTRQNILDNVQSGIMCKAVATCVSCCCICWNCFYDIIERLCEWMKALWSHFSCVCEWFQEEFNVRRKEFWALPSADKLLNNFIPMLSHEADGLIFQREGSIEIYIMMETPEHCSFPRRCMHFLSKHWFFVTRKALALVVVWIPECWSSFQLLLTRVKACFGMSGVAIKVLGLKQASWCTWYMPCCSLLCRVQIRHFPRASEVQISAHEFSGLPSQICTRTATAAASVASQTEFRL